ncbi:MAG: hypothetical protein ACFFER_04015 [Candidatus Thorarchaeota archaeon]
MAKKKSGKPKVSASMFKITGAHAKMKIDQGKERIFYFKEKVDSEEAMKNALKDGADYLGDSPTAAKAAKPSLKYEFYCIYDAVLEMMFLRLRHQELGVNEQVSGVLVGKEVILPKKGKTIPGRSLHLELIELFELRRSDRMTVDGKTGGPADAIEKLLKGPGKKKATLAWIRNSKIASGKYNSIEKVVKTVAKLAGNRPSDAKRVTEHTLAFNRLDGFYVPVYYVKVKAGEKVQMMRVNGLNGAVSLDV